MAIGHTDAAADPRPGSRGYLKWYMTVGKGRSIWVAKPHPWTALHNHLVKHGMGAEFAARTASQWFKEVFGYPPSARGGKNPVGPG